MSECVIEAVQLCLPCWIFHNNNPGSVAANDLLRITEQESQTSTKEHQNNEGNICSVGDSSSDFDVDISAESDLFQLDVAMTDSSLHTYKTAHTGANVEDSPEPCEITTFLVFVGVRHHDSTLSRPKNARTRTQ